MPNGESHGATQRLVLVGSVLVDLVMPVPSLPPRGGDLIAGGASFVVGGGYYVLSAATRAGMSAAFAGRHGAGPLGARVRAALDEIGVATLLPPDEHDDTGLCVTLVEPDGERTFVTHPGVEARLAESALVGADIDAADVVYVSGYDLGYNVSGPAIESWLTTRPNGQPLVLDPGPLVADIPADRLTGVLARTTLLTLNRREAALLTTATEATAAIAALQPRLGPDAVVIVRDGASGAHVGGGPLGSDVEHVAAPTVAARDTTGAGDVHTGALVAALAAGANIIDAVRRANTAAALHVSAIPTRQRGAKQSARPPDAPPLGSRQ